MLGFVVLAILVLSLLSVFALGLVLFEIRDCRHGNGTAPDLRSSWTARDLEVPEDLDLELEDPGDIYGIAEDLRIDLYELDRERREADSSRRFVESLPVIDLEETDPEAYC